MKKETEKILKYTPYNSYDDLFGAIYGNKANIKLSNYAYRQIAQIEKPIFANLGIHFGFIPSAIMTVVFAIYSENYLLLLLLLAECVFSFAIYLLHNFKMKTWLVSGIVIVCGLFLVKVPLSVLILALSWLFNSWVVSWWLKNVYKSSVKILQYNEEAFAWAYNSHNLLIEDCYGNIYSKLRQNELETASYERLLKVLKIGAGSDDVDSAICKFSAFYLKQGKDIPNELYWGITNHSKQKKRENLLKILELGIGIEGIDNVISRLVDFYTAKGIVFPNDI